MHTLEKYLAAMYDASQPVVVGHIGRGWGVHRAGKWAETKYPHRVYPPFPVGSYGHCVSRPVAEYIVSNKDSLTDYQGEDTSLGIWLSEAPFSRSVQFFTSTHVANHGDCTDTSLWMIGHDKKKKKMRACF